MNFVILAIFCQCMMGIGHGNTFKKKNAVRPFVMNTASGVNGLNVSTLAYRMITEEGSSLLDAVEKSISETCELNLCDDSIGPHGTLDELGDVTQDAMIMDGDTYEVGAVGNLRSVRAAIGVAHAVLKYTTHSFITGDQATAFAEEMGFPVQNLRTNETEENWQNWLAEDCQPNHRKNVFPDPSENCGPYSPEEQLTTSQDFDNNQMGDDQYPGDTICQIAISGGETPQVVVGTSTNGLNYKVPGRVGDSPIAGAGAFADSEVGAAMCIGNGDIMMRFLPSHLIVELMRSGSSPMEAVHEAKNRILRYFPDFGGAIFAANVDGEYGATCTGDSVGFALYSSDMDEAEIISVDCNDPGY